MNYHPVIPIKQLPSLPRIAYPISGGLGYVTSGEDDSYDFGKFNLSPGDYMGTDGNTYNSSHQQLDADGNIVNDDSGNPVTDPDFASASSDAPSLPAVPVSPDAPADAVPDSPSLPDVAPGSIDTSGDAGYLPALPAPPDNSGGGGDTGGGGDSGSGSGGGGDTGGTGNITPTPNTLPIVIPPNPILPGTLAKIGTGLSTAGSLPVMLNTGKASTQAIIKPGQGINAGAGPITIDDGGNMSSKSTGPKIVTIGRVNSLPVISGTILANNQMRSGRRSVHRFDLEEYYFWFYIPQYIKAHNNIKHQTGTVKYIDEYKGDDLDTFKTALRDAANDLGMNIDWLTTWMKEESGMNPHIQNVGDPARGIPATYATGLIQFMPDTAAGLGTSVDALKNMNATQQVPFIKKYYQQVIDRVKAPIKTAGETLLATFYPAAIGQNSDYVIGGVDKAGNPTKYARNIAQANPGMDVEKLGRITKGNVETYAKNKIKEFDS